MKVLVTGGAGFVGSHVAKRLVEDGHDVVIVDNFNEYYDPDLKERRVADFLAGLSFELHRVDIADMEALRGVFGRHRFDAVCHQAAQAGVRYSLENPFAYERSNVLGTLNLLELCREFGVKKFLFASTSSVYGANEKLPFSEQDPTDTPISLYAATKKACEVMAHCYHSLYGISAVGLRYFTVYGPWGRPDLSLFKFTKNMLEGKPIEVYGEGKMKRNFTYIDDVVQGVVLALNKSFAFEIFNIGYSSTVDLMDFIAEIENCLGIKAEKKFLPMQKGDVRATEADISKARELLGWEPKVSVPQGIPKFVEWYKEHYHTA